MKQLFPPFTLEERVLLEQLRRLPGEPQAAAAGLRELVAREGSQGSANGRAAKPLSATAAESPGRRRRGGGQRPPLLSEPQPPVAPGLEVLLQPRPLILAALPYHRDDAVREVSRVARTGSRSVLRVTYIATDSRQPLPFGSDRSLLAWLTTRAWNDGTVRFSAIADYLRAFGLDRGGRGYGLFWERFQRIASLAIRIEQIDEDARQVKRLFLIPESVEPHPLPRSLLHRPNERLLTYNRYQFRLDSQFWTYLRATRVPTPLALLRAFHGSPLRWDFAQFVLYRCYAARRPSVVPWREILEQLGTADRDHRRLKHQLARALEVIRRFESACGATFLPGFRGLAIAPCREASRPAPPLDQKIAIRSPSSD